MITVHQLGNGAMVLVEEIPYVRSAAIGVYVKVGSRNESPEINGISHFIEHMLFKGTSSRSAKDIAEIFEEMGGQLNAYTSREYTCYYTRILDENMDEAMDILFDMLYDSTLNPKDLDVERGVIIEEINMYEDTPDDLVHDVFSQTVFSDHAIGRPILGHADIIESLEPSVIQRYYRKHYRPQNMIIAVAGNVKTDEVIQRLENYRGYHEGPMEAEPETLPDFGHGVNLVTKDTEQVQICLGVPGISYLDDRRFAQNIMNSILGGGMSSRLFQKIREEKGLAYSVYSYPSSYRDTGTYVIYVGTSVGKIPDFFSILGDELKSFVSQGVSEEEVQRTKNQIKASMYLGMESVMTRMNRLGKSQMLYGKVPPLEEVMEKVFAVTPQMVQTYAEETLGRGVYSLASIGDKEALACVQEQYNQQWGK